MALANTRLVRVLQVKHPQQRSKDKGESMQANDKETGIIDIYYTFIEAYRK